MTTTNPIADCPNGIMQLNSSDAWEKAIDCVDYPVRIQPLFFKPSDDCLIELGAENMGADEAGYAPAIGDTNSGRNTQFFGVIVDRNRLCQESVISTVTGTYGTMCTAQVYRDLQLDLQTNNINSEPVSVYVSGNGGRALLTISVADSICECGDSKVKMRIILDTSVDGSKKHTMRLSVVDADGVEIVGLGEQNFTIGAKHTKTIGERHVAFSTVLVKLVREWEDSIMPMISLMNDCVFDRSFALDIFKNIMENAQIPERHVENALAAYRPQNGESMFGVLRGISTYLSEALSEKPERLENFRENINKKSRTLINKTLENFRKEQ